MQSKIRLMTVEEFRVFTELPENQDRNFELLAGEVIEVPTPTEIHAAIVARIIGLLFAFLDANEIEGTLVGDNLDFELGKGNILKPDGGFTSAARKPMIVTYPKIVPDLVFEVISPSNSAAEIFGKVQIYFANGAQLVWVVYPKTKTVQVYTPGVSPENPVSVTRTADDVIDAGDVLPGFTVKVSRLFPTLPLGADTP